MSDQHGERDLKSALRGLAADLERGLDDHPAHEDLVDFAAGGLAKSERDRIGEHLALCPECARLASEMAAAEPELERLTASELDAEWKRFQKAAGISRRRRFPLPKALAAVFITAVLGFAIWAIYELTRQPQADAVLVDLSPSDQTLRGAEEPVRLPDWAGDVVLVLNLVDPVPAHPEYRAEILAADGRSVWNRNVRQKDDAFVVIVPRRDLPNGAYRIRLLDPKGTELEVYELLIKP